MEALKRLRVYIGMPEEYKSFEKIKFEDAIVKKLLSFYLTLGELSERLG